MYTHTYYTKKECTIRYTQSVQQGGHMHARTHLGGIIEPKLLELLCRGGGGLQQRPPPRGISRVVRSRQRCQDRLVHREGHAHVREENRALGCFEHQNWPCCLLPVGYGRC